MASSNAELQERCKLYYKFTKVLTLKVAQIVVQSRQGKKITHECNAKLPDNGVDSSPQWVSYIFYLLTQRKTYGDYVALNVNCLYTWTIQIDCNNIVKRFVYSCLLLTMVFLLFMSFNTAPRRLLPAGLLLIFMALSIFS